MDDIEGRDVLCSVPPGVPTCLGKWGGREGIGVAKDLHAIFVGTKAFYLSHLTITADQFEKAAGNLIKEWEKYQTSYEFYVAYGQR